ncbi:hypothetical protein ACLOJK_022742 [Asimina triloba]
MGCKKKFIDKKKSATFQLLARDSSDSTNSNSSNGRDRVFVRVDNNTYTSHGFSEEDTDFDDSIFADAPGDEDDASDGRNRNNDATNLIPVAATTNGSLPDHVRREVLELGLPDDGYNYLLHLREIRPGGGGSSYHHNSKAKLDQLPRDVKAYDASRLQIHSEVGDGDSIANAMYRVASKTFNVRAQKAVDPDVAALLDDSDLSRFGSDMEDLEEDFVMKANLPEDEDEEEEEEEATVDERLEVTKGERIESYKHRGKEDGSITEENEWGTEKPRVHRLLDEQFDLLTRQEYDSDNEGFDYGYFDAESESLAAKLNHSLKDHAVDDLKLDDKYRFPGDFKNRDEETSNGKQVDSPADVIRRCTEYAEMYSQEMEGNEDTIILEESSDESEQWDCETIVSTYSNLDNHPGKIQDPEKPRKKLVAAVSSSLSEGKQVISLRGKEKLPVDFLPNGRKNLTEKVKKVPIVGAHLPKRRPHGEESKEEKKERKNEVISAVKEERREARRAKKELKGLYRSEAQQAQRIAAISAPCSIHLM